MDSDATPRLARLTVAEIEAVIEGFCQLQVNLIVSKHFLKQAAARGVTVTDAKRILTDGRIAGKQEWNDKFGDWTYGLRGTDVEGDELELRIGITPDRKAIVLVTVFEPN